MREILFRGKRIDNGEWVEGWLVRDVIVPRGQTYVLDEGYIDGLKGEAVHPTTIGQYTGVRDDNDERIFEGDVLQFSYTGKNRGVDGKAVVVFENGKFGVKWGWHKEFVPLDGFANTKTEVIGNIHDNPELWEKR